MPGKQQLVDLLNRSLDVVQSEVEILERWKNDPALTVGRASQIDLALRHITVGNSCALGRATFERDEAVALADAARPPDAHHTSAVEQTVDSVLARALWPGPTLSDDFFANALTQARDNSDQAAENSETIFRDCTAPGPIGGGGGPMVAAAAAVPGGGPGPRPGGIVVALAASKRKSSGSSGGLKKKATTKTRK